jgi:hypothetical protein
VSPRQKLKVSNAVRDRIVLDHLPLVKAIVVRMHENLPVHVDLDDLVHAGVLGLFDAATKYNPPRRSSFTATQNTGSRERFWTACDSSTGRRAIYASARRWWSPSPAI